MTYFCKILRIISMINKVWRKLWVFLLGFISFLIFMITSQFFTLLILFPFTNEKKSARTFYTNMLTLYARFILKTHLNLKIRYHYKSNGQFLHPMLIVCNHQSIIDVPVSLSLTSKIRVLNNNWHNNKLSRFFITKYIGFYSIYNDLDFLADELKPSIDKDCSLLVFPEGIMSREKKIHRFHKGGFYLAQKLNLDIQPVVIYYSDSIIKKSWFYLKNGNVIIKFLDPIRANTQLYGSTYQELTNNVMAAMRLEYNAIKAAQES